MTGHYLRDEANVVFHCTQRVAGSDFVLALELSNTSNCRVDNIKFQPQIPR